MKVDTEATKTARERQARGIERLNEAFNVDAALILSFVANDQRWLSRSKASRRLYRQARMASDPGWARRREHRKRQRRARKEQR